MAFRWRRAILTGVCLAGAGVAEAQRADTGPVLAAVAESLLARAHGKASFASDVATAEALAGAAGRRGLVVARASGRVWCAPPPSGDGIVGTLLRLSVDSIAIDRAVVGWSATCLLVPRGDTVPAAFGEGGAWEVVRRQGSWRVVRPLVELAY